MLGLNFLDFTKWASIYQREIPWSIAFGILVDLFWQMPPMEIRPGWFVMLHQVLLRCSGCSTYTRLPFLSVGQTQNRNVCLCQPLKGQTSGVTKTDILSSLPLGWLSRVMICFLDLGGHLISFPLILSLPHGGPVLCVDKKSHQFHLGKVIGNWTMCIFSGCDFFYILNGLFKYCFLENYRSPCPHS